MSLHLSICPSMHTFYETSLEQTSYLLGEPAFSLLSGSSGCYLWRDSRVVVEKAAQDWTPDIDRPTPLVSGLSDWSPPLSVPLS